MNKFPNATVTIHIEPCDGNCTEICVAGCLLPESGKTANHAGEGLTSDEGIPFFY